MQLRATQSKPVSEGKRTLRFIASDETPDRMGDIIQVSGWNLSSYKQNPVVLWGHDSSTVPPIGRATNVRRGRKPNGEPALFANIEFAPEEAHPFAETVYQLAKRGFLNAVSVGFLPRKTKEVSEQERQALGMPAYGQVYSEADLLEISVVSVPANPSALVSQARSLVTENIVGKGQVDLFLDHVAKENPSIGDQIRAHIKEFTESAAAEVEQKSPACRQDGETTAACVERKIPELIEEGMEQDQAVAVANSLCETACSEKGTPDFQAKHILAVSEDEDTYTVTYSKMGEGAASIDPAEVRGSMEEDEEEEEKGGDYDEEDEEEKSLTDSHLAALLDAQAEQAKALTTLTDSISDLTKRLDILGGGMRGGLQPDAPVPAPSEADVQEQVEARLRQVTDAFLNQLSKRK
jgi:HK97 family phage prohead protease